MNEREEHLRSLAAGGQNRVSGKLSDIWPYTLFAVVPTNNRLKAINSMSTGSRNLRLVDN
jgi:hypothetical protein